ncbi:hypothetical protein GFC30_2910 [Anoxybacillus amylolyticus]|uniref:Uncharacterized protein n=1 Tax=Anoxybacteroides amylolyticum TaxID=294699 RepID=A0A160F2S4_9BACL|nr:hypothetical protein GFC30_2910 [Anoxybacillus amylolyticus]
MKRSNSSRTFVHDSLGDLYGSNEQESGSVVRMYKKSGTTFGENRKMFGNRTKIFIDRIDIFFFYYSIINQSNGKGGVFSSIMA